MVEIEFIYNGMKSTIQSNKNDKMKDIIQRFIFKLGKEKNNFYFLYGGQQINEYLSFDEQANEEDKMRNKMCILVNDENNSIINKNLKKSKNIICPKCKELIKINIKDYKIFLYDCKNGHKLDNIFINEFEKTQNIDESKIICNICNNNDKSKAFNNQFFKCFSCDINICPLCKLNHEKVHKNIYNYDIINYMCKIHNKSYNSYCKKCNKNLCILCEKEHNNHGIISYGEIIPNIDNLNEEMNKYKQKIDDLNKVINKFILKLNSIIENMKIIYKINNNIINNYDINNNNYIILQNINEISKYNNNIIKEIDKIINEKNIKNFFNSLSDIYTKMSSKNKQMIDKDDLTDNEKNEAKTNGFILLGMTGAGKTTLLNAMFGKEVGKVERNLKRVTQNATVYYYRLENGKCISIIDTPGLSDNFDLIKQNDNNEMNLIKEFLMENRIQLKGILFLINFQNERFNADEQEALLFCHKFFPFKNFWKNILIIFTHHFADPDGDYEKEMKMQREINNKKIFNKLMDKVKDESDIIDYKQLKIKYFNSYFPVKNEKQKKKNILVRDELEIELNKIINL